jgi:hypothetical protein
VSRRTGIQVDYLTGSRAGRWASEAIDLINDLPSAAELVGILAAQAENALARAGRHQR